ncbi:MAG: sigma 54-interacting transcriptional regulator [Myxococcales bacterium]|nr:sigma 54-interacting transcriptional regulator [Myxococcales bacterium]
MTERQPTLLPRYELLRRLPSAAGGADPDPPPRIGGGSLLALRHDVHGTRTVVLKPLRGARRELRLLHGLIHPNLLLPERVVDVAFDEGAPEAHLLLDYAEDGDLAAWFPHQRDLTTSLHAVAPLLQLARALTFLHDLGLIHGDVKPANVVVSRSGPGHARFRLTDFDCLTTASPTSGSAAAPDEAHDDPGGLSGTPAFLAPEAFIGAPPSAAADCFAFGVTAVWLLSGEHLFGTELQAVREAQLNAARGSDYEPLLARALGSTSVSPPLRRLLVGLLSPDPVARTSMRRALADLSAIATPEGERPFATGELIETALSRATAPGDFGREALRARVLAPPAKKGRPRVFILQGAPGLGRTSFLRSVAFHARADGAWTTDPQLPDSAAGVSAWLPASMSSPFVLADDWHLADPELRLAVVSQIRLGDASLTALLALPSPDVTPGALQVLSDTRAALQGFATIETLTLSPLESGDGGAEQNVLRRLLSRLAGDQPVPPETVLALARATGGHPSFIRAALEELARTGRAPVLTGAPFPADMTSLLPESLSALAASRVVSLPQSAQQLVALLAAAGGSVPAPVAAVFLDVTGQGAAAALLSAELAFESDTGRLALVGEAALRAASSVALPPDATLDVVLDALARLGPVGARARVGLLGTRGSRREAVIVAAETGCYREGAVWARLDVSEDAALLRAQIVIWTHLADFEAARLAVDALSARTDANGGDDAELRDELAMAALLAGRHRDAVLTLEHGPAGPDRRSSLTITARALVHLGELDRATHALDRGDALDAHVGSPDEARWQRHALVTRALVALYRGLYSEADEACQRAFARFDEPGEDGFPSSADGTELALLENALGVIAQRQGRLDDAARWYVRSRDVAGSHGNDQRRAIAVMNLGTVEHERGALGSALGAYRDAARIGRKTGDATGVVKALTNEANVLVACGDRRAALSALGRAAELPPAIENRFLHAYLSLITSEAQLLGGRLEDAMREADRALREFESLGNRRERADALLVLARLALKRQDAPAFASHLGDLAAERGALSSDRLTVHEAVLRSAWQRLRPSDDEVDLANDTDEPELDPHDQAPPSPVATERDTGPIEALVRSVAPFRTDLHFALQAELLQVALTSDRHSDARRHATELLRLEGRILDGLDEAHRPMWLGQVDVRETVRIARTLVKAPAGRGLGPDGADFVGQVLELNKRLAAESEPERLLRTILDVAITVTGAERGFLLTPGADGDLEVRVARNLDQAPMRKAQIRFSKGVADRVYAGGKAIASVDAQGDQRLQGLVSVHAMKLRSVLCVPMRHGVRPIGVIYVDNRFQRGAFSDDRVAFLEAFADQAALALQSALFVERERDARARLEAALESLARQSARVEALNAELATELSRRTAELGTEVARTSQLGDQLARAAADLEETRAALRSAKVEHDSLQAMIGDSPPMVRVRALIERVASAPVPLLVYGESGTGKELVARAAHALSERPGRLVAINCAALPEALLESELFGVVRGAYTGADRDRVGLFEEAHQGTLFLDELGEMPLAMQAKLLRVLETMEVRRVGGTTTKTVDVRVVAATHRDLPAAITAGRFRQDLYFRLKVVEIRLPPLRDRPGDVRLLAAHLLARIGERWKLGARQLTVAALRALEAHSWPGNVRELESVLTSAALTAQDGLIGVEHLGIATTAPSGPAGGAVIGWDGASTLAQLEAQIVRDAWERLGRNKSKTARALDMDRNTLAAKLQSTEER